jgi:hypothetical protein
MKYGSVIRASPDLETHWKRRRVLTGSRKSIWVMSSSASMDMRLEFREIDG